MISRFEKSAPKSSNHHLMKSGKLFHVVVIVTLLLLCASQLALRVQMAELKRQISSACEDSPFALGPQPVKDKTLAMNIEGYPSIGEKSARVTVIEFSDFQCPFSGRHARGVLPQILKEFVQTGKVKYVYGDFPLEFHPLALKAAVVARCAGNEGKFWEMHDHLFANLGSLSDIGRLMRELGLDSDQFRACLDNSQTTADVQHDQAEAIKAGIQSTPSFLLGFTDANAENVRVVRLISGAQPFSIFQSELDSLLDPKARSPR